MNKRIVAGMLFTTVVCMTLGGCGFTADKENVKNSGAVESVMPGAEVSTEMTEEMLRRIMVWYSLKYGRKKTTSTC